MSFICNLFILFILGYTIEVLKARFVHDPFLFLPLLLLLSLLLIPPTLLVLLLLTLPLLCVLLHIITRTPIPTPLQTNNRTNSREFCFLLLFAYVLCLNLLPSLHLLLLLPLLLLLLLLPPYLPLLLIRIQFFLRLLLLRLRIILPRRLRLVAGEALLLLAVSFCCISCYFYLLNIAIYGRKRNIFRHVEVGSGLRK